MKPVGKPDAGNPHVRFDERGGETERQLNAQATAPFLDSTKLGETLGLDRVTRDVTPDLATIIAQHTAGPANLHRNAARKTARASKRPEGIRVLQAEPTGPLHEAPEPTTGAAS